MRLTIPDPALVVLVGPAGSGKSTFAARHFQTDEVLSSDAYRAIVGTDEADQTATKPAFAALHRALARRLVGAKLTVVDATNVEAHARRQLVRRARAAGVPAIAIVFDLPAPVVLERNARRPGRVVDPSIVHGHLGLLRTTVDRGLIEGEGFAAVYRISEPAELAVLEVARQASWRVGSDLQR